MALTILDKIIVLAIIGIVFKTLHNYVTPSILDNLTKPTDNEINSKEKFQLKFVPKPGFETYVQGNHEKSIIGNHNPTRMHTKQGVVKQLKNESRDENVKFYPEDATNLARLLAFNKNYFRSHYTALDATPDQMGQTVLAGVADIVASDGKTLIGPPQSRETLGLLFNQLNFTNGVEVGVYYGIFSAILLSQWAKCVKYTLVDIEIRNETLKHLEKWKKIVVPVQGKSLDILKTFDNESLDFAYIDAMHDYCNVLDDMTAWWPKIKNFGILAGHDFVNGASFPKTCRGEMHPQTVKGAVLDFVRSQNQRLFVTYKAHEWTLSQSWIIQKII